MNGIDWDLIGGFDAFHNHFATGDTVYADNEPLYTIKEEKPKMRIYISTMDELPEECIECPCYRDEECRAFKEENGSYRGVYGWRPFWCPLKLDEIDEAINNPLHHPTHDQYGNVLR